MRIKMSKSDKSSKIFYFYNYYKLSMYRIHSVKGVNLQLKYCEYFVLKGPA